MIIDAHAHILNEETYSAYVKNGGGRVDKIVAIAELTMPDKHGIFKPFELEKLLAFAATKKNIWPVGVVDCDTNIPGQLKKFEQYFQDKKIIGLKLLPGYQHFYPSDEKIFPVAELCAKFNKPLVIHTGDVYDNEGIAELKYAHPLAVDTLAMKNPSCPIVIAHFGFPYFLEAANVVSKNKNVYTDISGMCMDVGSQKATSLLVQECAKDLRRTYAYFPDVMKKTMFGTDFSGDDTPLNQIDPYIQLVKKAFSPELHNHVFSGLAQTLFFS